jgi:ABC-type Mn2+/Zn2+ transport system ATPase subunit
MDEVMETTYDFFNRKLFSLPKLMLLPSIIMRQPMLVAQITPFIFGSDFLKAKIMAFLTTNIEKLKKENMEIQAIRTKVEAFDMKNAELLQRSGVGATSFTQRKWEELTVNIQQMSFMAEFLNRTKRFFNWIQHHFVFSVLIDCALAHLIAVGKIVSADIFVFSRAIEDAVDTVLMRSRAESELARMLTQIGKLEELSNVWKNSRTRPLLPCRVTPSSNPNTGIVLKNLHYSRGSASVSIDHVDITPAIYALTGANGSGKSTLFRILMSCSTNEQSTDLPSSIAFSSPALPIIEDDDPVDACSPIDEACPPPDELSEKDPIRHHPKLEIIMPSSDVAEISQTFYWPLYTRPIDWIYQRHLSESDNVDEMARKVAEILQALEFRQFKQDDQNVTETACLPVDVVMEELLETKEDWFSDLSGGQKSKVELVRKVFLHEKCPSVLLIDETMAPLDPSSKSLVMSKLKAFCNESVVIVIYHTDVQSDENGGQECVPSNNFFDQNIHLENRTLNKRPLC